MNNTPQNRVIGNLLSGARDKLLREDTATRQLSDTYLAATDRANAAAGTPEGAQTALDAAKALADYNDMAQKYAETLQLVENLMNAFQ